MQSVNRRQFTFGALWAAVVGLFVGKAEAIPNDPWYLPKVDPGQIETMELKHHEGWNMNPACSLIRWIPVSERLPDAGFNELHPVLTAWDSGRVTANYVWNNDGSKGWLNSDYPFKDSRITHWAELPEGPKVQVCENFLHVVTGSDGVPIAFDSDGKRVGLDGKPLS